MINQLVVLLLLLKAIYSYVKFDNVDRNWDSAETYCQNQCGSNLASIHSQQDWDDVLALGGASSNKDIFIGLRDWNNNGAYTWSDSTTWNWGITWSQNPWKDGQPSDANEECVVIFGGARLWGDTPCNNIRPFICNGNCVQTVSPTSITASPTTYTPTTSNPTTISPTTVSPTTAIPTTSVPTTMQPTNIPSTSPSKSPTKLPTTNPSISPTKTPTNNPSQTPIIVPTNNPTVSPVRNGEAGVDTTSQSENNNGHAANTSNNNTLGLYAIFGITMSVLLVCICIILFLLWRRKNDKRKRKAIDQKYEDYNHNMATELGRVKSLSSDGEQHHNDTGTYEIDIEETSPDIATETNTDMVMDAVNAEPNVYSDQSAVKMWLHSIGLVQYYKLFMQQGFGDQMGSLLSVTDQDLETMGIKKMAHRKRILLQIENNRHMLANNNENGEQYNIYPAEYDQNENNELYDNTQENDSNNMLQNEKNTVIGSEIGNNIVTAGYVDQNGVTPMGNTYGNEKGNDNEESDDDENDDMDKEMYKKPHKVTHGNVDDENNNENDNENLLTENEDESEDESEDEQDLNNEMYQKSGKITNN